MPGTHSNAKSLAYVKLLFKHMFVLLESLPNVGYIISKLHKIITQFYTAGVSRIECIMYVL